MPQKIWPNEGRKIVRFYLIVIFALLFGFAAFAGQAIAKTAASAAKQPSAATQNSDQPAKSIPLVEETLQKLDTFSKTISDVGNQLNDGVADDDDALAKLQSQVDQITVELAKLQSAVETKLDEVRAQLSELGTAPGPGEPPEPGVTTKERNDLLAERSQINAVVDKASKLAETSGNLSDQISTVRRDKFTATLFEHTNIRELLSSDFGALLRQEASNFSAAYGGWASFVWASKRVEFIVALSVSVFAAFFFYRISSRIVERTTIDFEADEPDYVARLLAAFAKTIVPSLVLLAFLTVSYVLFISLGIFQPDVERFLRAAYIAVGSIIFVFLLSRNVLAPGRPRWRLVPISSSAARNLTIAFTAMAFINWTDQMFGLLNNALDADLRLEILRSLASSVLIGCILIAISFIHPRRSVTAVSGKQTALNLFFPSLVSVLGRIVGVFVVCAALIGYVALARFVALQILLTGAVLITMYIGMLVGQAVSQAGSLSWTSSGRRLIERFSLSSVRADQISLLSGLLVYAVTLMVGIPLILMSWGLRYEELRLWISNNLTAITIGSITISLGGILIGILLFVGGFFVTRWFEGWFDNNVLLRSRADAGVRNSVKTGIKYLGVTIAGLLAISAAGVNLSSLALVASALSIGIGFGLQTIVSNFVSGLILLVERPFKVGDWIVSGSAEGFVKRISVRATEIETFQRQSIIVPNSELINASVGNWMHHNQMGRSEVAVGVSYDSDPRRVMDILMEIGTSHPLVLQNPEPSVIFMGFGESTLDFEVRVYLADVFNGIAVRNDIRVAIFERFRDEGITIPYPQRDLHIIPQKERRDELADSIRKHKKRDTLAEKSEPEAVSKPMFDHPDTGNDDGGER